MPRLLFDEPLSEELNRLALSRGAPPKFIWIRLGNCSTDDIAQLLRRRHADIMGEAPAQVTRGRRWLSQVCRPPPAPACWGPRCWPQPGKLRARLVMKH